MAIKIACADEKIEIVPDAVNADYNYREGTYDFCDEKGQPMKRLVMETGVTWSQTDESDASSPESSKRHLI